MKAHERIKELRKNILHLSQKDFAEQINISRSNLGNIFVEDSHFFDDQIVSLYSMLTDENKKYLYGYIQRLLDEQANADLQK